MNWKQVAIGEVAEIVSGATPKSSVAEYWGGDISWATPTDLSKLRGKHLKSTERSITRKGLSTCSARVLPENSVLFSSRAPIGLVAINATPMATNQGFKSFIPSDSLDSKFLFWWLKANRQRLDDIGTGATFKEVSKRVIAEVQIPLPPIDEQRRIAAILDKADAIRRRREQALDLADEFLKSVFLEMFGDPVLNPYGFRESRLDQLADITSGLTKGRKTKDDQVLRAVPYMRVANVQDGHLNLSEIKEIEATPAEIEKCLLKKGDLLLTEGGDPDKLGRGSVWNDEIEECIHQNHIFRVRLFSEEIDPKILQLQIGSPRGKRYFLQAAKQTTGIASINKRQLSAYPVLIPDENLQNEYLNIASTFRTTIENLEASWIESSHLFSSISQRAFRGEL